jgi:hypothetical protein
MLFSRLSSSVLLCCLTFLALVLVAPAAAAVTIDGDSPAVTAVSPTGSHPGPVLASTGLDIAMPVVIGLGTLILGILLVAWAFLRTGSAEHR